MNHLVLARKYRPSRFADVVGQDLIVGTIKSAIEKNRMAHALLFTGGRGIGKTTIARIVAKAMVCLNKIGAEPCNTCAQCTAIDGFSSLDVLEIDGASHTSVDDVRDLRDSARYQPTSAKFKIFIIDEVHMLSISAFNALLKILEEPPAHVVFIFATTESHKLPQTILSRCQRYDFKRLSVSTIQATLKSVIATEGYTIDDKGLFLIATLADGAMRDALSMSEQILSSGQKSYSSEEVAKILGVVSHQAIKGLARALLDKDVSSGLFIIKDIYEKGLDICQLMDGLCERFRLLSLCAHVDQNKAMALIENLSEEDFLESGQYQKEDLKRLFAMAIDQMPQVFQAQKPLLALELFVLKAALRPTLGDAMSINYCLQKLDAIMHNRPLPPEPQWFLKPEALTAPKKSEVGPVGPKNPEEVLKLFAKLVSNINDAVPGLSAHLRLGRAQLEEDSLLITFEQSLHYERALLSKNHPALKQEVKELFGVDSFRFELKALPESLIKSVAELDEENKITEQKALYDKALNNPLVKKALEIFGGDITEVKRFDNHITRDLHAK